MAKLSFGLYFIDTKEVEDCFVDERSNERVSNRPWG